MRGRKHVTTFAAKPRAPYRVIPVAATDPADKPHAMGATTIRVGLELQRDSDPIQGRLSDERGHTVDFIGWLELITVLETAKRGEHALPPPALAPPRRTE